MCSSDLDIVKVTFVKVANNISDGYDNNAHDELDVSGISVGSVAYEHLLATISKDISGGNIIVGLYPVDNIVYLKKTAGSGSVSTSCANFILDWRIKIVAIKFNY